MLKKTTLEAELFLIFLRIKPNIHNFLMHKIAMYVFLAFQFYMVTSMLNFAIHLT